jgi:UDP-N-acetyl-D-mannosaminuronate dehydrogenase
VVELIEKAAGPLEGLAVAVLGLAYKPDVDDLRESPAVHVARELAARGAHLVAYEPYKADADIPGVRTAPDLETALAGSQVVVVLVAHTPVRDLKPAQVAALTAARLVIDTVNLWDPAVWEPAGFQLKRLGVGSRSTGRG